MATITISGLCALEWQGSTKPGLQSGHMMVHLLNPQHAPHHPVLVARAGDVADLNHAGPWTSTIVPPGSSDPEDTLLVWSLDGVGGDVGNPEKYLQMYFQDGSMNNPPDWHRVSGFPDLIAAAGADTCGVQDTTPQWGVVRLSEGLLEPCGTMSPLYLFGDEDKPDGQTPTYVFASRALYTWDPAGSGSFMFPCPGGSVVFKPTARLSLSNQPQSPVLEPSVTCNGRPYGKLAHFHCLLDAVGGHGRQVRSLWAGRVPRGSVTPEVDNRGKPHPQFAMDPDHCIMGFVRT